MTGSPDAAETSDANGTSGAVRGRVVHHHGAPAAGALVTLVGPDGRELAVSPVDQDGAFAADPGPERPVLMIAGLAGARPAARHLLAGEDALDRPLVLAAPPA